MATNNTIPSDIAGMTNQQRASLGQGYSNVTGSYNTATGQLNTPQSPIINTATQPIPVGVISNPSPAYTNLPIQTPQAPLAPAPLTFEQYNEQKIKDTTPAVDKAYEAYKNAMGLGETQGQRTISAEEQAGIPQLQKEFTDVTNQINQKDLEFRRQREAISQEAGLTQAQAGAKLADVTRKQNSEMADLEVIRASKSNSLANIQNAVSRKLELQFKDETARIDNLKTIYQDVKGDLTKAEDRKVDMMIKREERKLDQEYNDAKLKQNVIIDAAQYGAPTSLLQAAQKAATPEEAAIILRRYSQNYISMQNRLNSTASALGINTKLLNTTQFKNAQAAQNLKNTLNKAIDAVKTYGNREVVNAEGKGILDSLKVQLRSEISTALEQGVVVPGEAAAFDAIAGQINKSFFIRNAKTLGSLNSLAQSMDSRINTQKAALQGTYGIDSNTVDTLLGSTELTDQDLNDMSLILGL